MIVIIGGGPTGLGAAWRLAERGETEWVLLEAAPSVGGLASSVRDEAGFTWDLGGHVLFSHYDYFDRLMICGWAMRGCSTSGSHGSGCAIASSLIRCRTTSGACHPTTCGVVSRACWTVYLARRIPAPDFHEWILHHFGTGLADVFMLPYNRKVWATEPRGMDCGWVGERVATVDVRRVLQNLVHQRDDCSWGPNVTFRFPLHGGTGAIWTECARRLPPAHLRCGTEVVEIRADDRVVRTNSGDDIHYDRLLSTMPCDILLQRIVDRPQLTPLAKDLRFSTTHLAGVGLQGQAPDFLKQKNWMYFPEDAFPFYRATVFSNYSENNVPRPGQQWSLLCEMSESATFPLDASTWPDRVVEALSQGGFIVKKAVESLWYRRLKHGYPIPFLGRDRLLGIADDTLRLDGIYSRGRFGAWKYEVSNQDHSLMQGVEAIDHFLDGTRELTYHEPSTVNTHRTR